MATDFELLEAWRGGDKAAGNVLVRRHFAAVFRFFELKVPRHAKDLTQKSLLGCVEKREGIRADGTFKAYLFGVARNQLLLHFRSNYRADKVFSPAEHTIDKLGEVAKSPTSILAKHDQQRLLLAALRRIPIDFQIAVELFYWEEMSIAEIAEVQDVATGTIKSRLGRARGMLRDRIEELTDSDELRRSTLDNLERWASSLRELAIDDKEGE